MTNRQDEIREGIAILMPSHCEECQVDTSIVCVTEEDDKPCNYQYLLADNTLKYLHSQGVVLKVNDKYESLFNVEVDNS